MLPWMPTRGRRRRTFRESDATFSSRRRARNRGGVQGEDQKQLPTKYLASLRVGKAPLSFPATVPSTTFHSQTPIVSSGYLRSARDREPARARGSTRHTRGSDTPSAAGTTAQLYTYIRARPYVLVGATFVTLYLSSVGVGTRKALLWLSERGSLVAPGRPNAKKPTLELFPLHRRKPRHPRRRQLAHLRDDREPCTNKLVEPAGPKRHSSWADDCQMKTLT